MTYTKPISDVHANDDNKLLLLSPAYQVSVRANLDHSYFDLIRVINIRFKKNQF